MHDSRRLAIKEAFSLSSRTLQGNRARVFGFTPAQKAHGGNAVPAPHAQKPRRRRRCDQAPGRGSHQTGIEGMGWPRARVRRVT